MSTKISALWLGDPTIEVRWRTWGDETIIYNCNSGDTHLLNRISAEALKILQENPADAETLTQKIAFRYELQNNQELLQHMKELLSLFSDLGLIIPANEN